MKVIDLLNMIEKCEYPSRIEVLGHKFAWDSLEGFYKEVVDGADLMEMTNSYPIYQFLDFEVKIADKNKGQEEIDIQGIEDLEYKDNWEVYENKTNYICRSIKSIKAVKQLDNKIKEKE